jgi:hypothetical protein
LLAGDGAENLVSYSIEVEGQIVKVEQTVPSPRDITRTARTSKYFALEKASSVTFLQAADLKKQVTLSHGSPFVSYSILDDVVLIQQHEAALENPFFFNVETGKEESLPSVSDKVGCRAYRVEESETVEHGNEHLTYAVQCKKFLGLFNMQLPQMTIEPLFKTQGGYLGSLEHGVLLKAFRNAKGFVV